MEEPVALNVEAGSASAEIQKHSIQDYERLKHMEEIL